MSITGGLLAFSVRHVFDVSADRLIEMIEKRLTDHGQILPKALAKANDQAWQAVGLALAGDGLFDRVRDVFRDADLKGVRDQIKKFLDQTPTGLENANASMRMKATEEWSRLRKEGRFAADTLSAAELGRRVATMERYGDPALMTVTALHVVKEAAEAVRAEAPHLADLLTAAPDGGTPLLAAAFAFFFRRELESNAELAHGLSFDYLRQISVRQEHGLNLLDIRTSGILDQINVLFDVLDDWFSVQDAKLDEIKAKLDHLIRLRDIPTSTSEPLKVTVTNKGELELLQSIRNQLRNLPPELVAAADWTKLGGTLAAAGFMREAGEAHEAAAEAAKSVADREAEAEAEYKRFRDLCETGDRAAAMAAFHRAVELAPDRFKPVDLDRYTPRPFSAWAGSAPCSLLGTNTPGSRRTNNRRRWQSRRSTTPGWIQSSNATCPRRSTRPTL
jgi:tetratricopeptide (TPR) repeat protein